jgi:hypothetical protein
MKRALALLIVGVILLAIGVGIWVAPGTPKPVYATPLSLARGIPTSYTYNSDAGFGAGLTVFGLAMTAGGIAMIVKQRKP